VSTPLAPRGVRNNNPLNIRKSNAEWVGMAPVQSDPDFVQFDDAVYGIRAGCKIIKTYVNRGLNTISKIISTWAPPSDNNPTDAYVANVAGACGINPTDIIDLSVIFPKLIGAMIKQEQGLPDLYPDDVIAQGIALA
jgi:hypothetical protein